MALTVQSALTIALRNSPDLLVARDQIQSANAQARLQYTPYNPTFSVSATNTRLQNSVPIFYPNYPYGKIPLQATQNQYLFNATISQLIYDFGRVHFNGLAAKLREKQSRQTYRNQLEQLLQTVETLYLNATLADMNVDIARQRVTERRSALKISNDLYKGGFVAAYDVLQYKSQLGQALQQLLTAEGSAEKARESLVVALGLAPGTVLTLDTQHTPSPPPADGQAGLDQALIKRPEIAALTWAAKAARANVSAMARYSAPTVSLSAQYLGSNPSAYSNTGAQVPGNFIWSEFNIIGTLNIPILDGRVAHWEKKQAEATLSQAEHQLAVTRRSVEQEVISAFTDLKTYWQQVTLAKETAAQAKEAYQIALVRYREGFSSSIELLNAQDTYVQADQALATAIYNYQVAEVNWRRAISGDYPVALPDSVKVDWEQPAPLTIPSTWPVAPTPSPTKQSPSSLPAASPAPAASPSPHRTTPAAPGASPSPAPTPAPAAEPSPRGAR